MSTRFGSLNTLAFQRSALELEGSLAGPLAAPAAFSPGQILCECGASLSTDFYKWVGASIGAGAIGKSGAIIMADFNWTEKVRVEFHGARVFDVGFPRLDAASLESGRFGIRFNVASQSQSKVAGHVPIVPHVQKKWLCNVFKLSIPGINTSVITAIEPFRVQKGSALPELVIKVKANGLAGFAEWLKTREARTSTLTYFFADLQPFCTLNFKPLQIAAIDDSSMKSVAERLSGALSFGQVRLTIGGITLSQP